MAILIDYQNISNDLNIKQAYVKLLRFEYNEVPFKHINITVNLFSSKEARNNNKEPFETLSFEVDLRDSKNSDLFADDIMAKDGVNFKQACYKYLKKLDTFKNGKDD